MFEKCRKQTNLFRCFFSTFPTVEINFDLHDCDKILRVKGENFIAEEVMILVKENGFSCNVLE